MSIEFYTGASPHDNPPQIALELRDVGFSFEKEVPAGLFRTKKVRKVVVQDVSFSVPDGKLVKIIGPSGVGKSTLLRAIMRMEEIPPIQSASTRTGDILIHPRSHQHIDVRTLSEEELRGVRVGMVFQKPNPFPKSIYENVAFGPRLHGIKDKEMLDDIVQKSLYRAGLWDEVSNRLDESALRLSGGQQQRLCIARTIALDPPILLMDEPTSSLDNRAGERIEDLIREELNGITIILVTHNLEQARRLPGDTVSMVALKTGNGDEVMGTVGRIWTQGENPSKPDLEQDYFAKTKEEVEILRSMNRRQNQ